MSYCFLSILSHLVALPMLRETAHASKVLRGPRILWSFQKAFTRRKRERKSEKKRRKSHVLMSVVFARHHEGLIEVSGGVFRHSRNYIAQAATQVCEPCNCSVVIFQCYSVISSSPHSNRTSHFPHLRRHDGFLITSKYGRVHKIRMSFATSRITRLLDVEFHGLFQLRVEHYLLPRERSPTIQNFSTKFDNKNEEILREVIQAFVAVCDRHAGPFGRWNHYGSVCQSRSQCVIKTTCPTDRLA